MTSPPGVVAEIRGVVETTVFVEDPVGETPGSDELAVELLELLELLLLAPVSKLEPVVFEVDAFEAEFGCREPPSEEFVLPGEVEFVE
mmetsp:Transcript_73672/g.159421  ORF Transcript_73672/g.159421 Transcript_73672/m.159421 type:complete len:88 (+) Transcript_73672:261-524(+)